MPKRNLLTETNTINALFDLYGTLLTTHQQAMIKDYYQFNLSLKEIAEQRTITRAAVSDALTQAKRLLMKFEKALKVNDLQETLRTWLTDDSVPTSLKKKILLLLNR